MYKVLKAPHLCLGFSAKFAQGWIQGGAIIGQQGTPYPKDFFFRPEGYNNNPNDVLGKSTQIISLHWTEKLRNIDGHERGHFKIQYVLNAQGCSSYDET